MKQNGTGIDIANLLQTKDRKEQGRRVQQLVQAAQAPVLDLVIRHDARSGQTAVTVIGGNLTFQDCYFILGEAEKQLRARELEEAKRAQPVAEEQKETVKDDG